MFFQHMLPELLNREEDCMTLHTETIGYHVINKLNMLSSFGKCCQRFSTFVADSCGGRFANIVWKLCKLCRLKLKTFEQVEQVTGLRFPLELGMVTLKFRVQERKNSFQEFYQVFSKAEFDKAKARSKKISKNCLSLNPKKNLFM